MNRRNNPLFSKLGAEQSTIEGTRQNKTSTDQQRRCIKCVQLKWCTRTTCSLVLVSLVLIHRFIFSSMPDFNNFMELEATEPQHSTPISQNSIPASVTESESNTEVVSRPKQDRVVVQDTEHDTDTAIDTALDTAIDTAIDAMAPWSNVTTLAMWGDLYSGFRNQMMVFTLLVFHAQMGAKGSKTHGQLLLESLTMKDFLGTNKRIPFATLWDIPHWNSHYPRLPRLVHYDPILHDQYNNATRQWYRLDNLNFTNRDKTTSITTPTKPYSFAKQHLMMSGYMRYAKGKGPYTDNNHRNAAEKIILRGALRPHPKLRALIDRSLRALTNTTVSGSGSGSGSHPENHKIRYITLHARVEPDMQRHGECIDKKVLRLKDIFEFMERKWPDDPPAEHVFMPINRKVLEKHGRHEALAKLRPFASNTNNGTSLENLLREGTDAALEAFRQTLSDADAERINWIAVENLRALNKARDEGLWNGRTKVFEFGSQALIGTEYSHLPSTTGALVDFFVGIGGTIFIGTEVSSFSLDLLATRFFRGNLQNYKYLPDGLHEWTTDPSSTSTSTSTSTSSAVLPPDSVDPPAFKC